MIAVDGERSGTSPQPPWTPAPAAGQMQHSALIWELSAWKHQWRACGK